MKIFFLSFAFCFSFAVSPMAHGQIATKEDETARNALLLDNAAKAAAAQKEKNAALPVQEIKMIGGPLVDPINSGNLTDQEKQLSENYIHQGKANQIITEKCAGDMRSVCNGQAGDHKFLGVTPTMIKAAAQMYALFGAFGDKSGGLTTKEAAKNKENPATEGAAKGKEEEKVNDYCRFIPVFTEGLAKAVQTAKTSELAGPEYGGGDTAQRDSLLKAAKSHDSRAKMAQIQAAGWFGGAACYAVKAASPTGWAIDRNLIIKMGAATFLGAFYQNEVFANKDYADKTRKIANSLPGKGDCNPITDRLCYCSEPTTENDPNYCATGLHKFAIAPTSYRVACTTSDLKIDPTCTCQKTNNCFDTYLETQSEGALNLGLGYGTSPFNSIRSLARGELVGGTIDSSSSTKATSAIAKRGLEEALSQVPLTNNPLNKDQQQIAAALSSKGVPGTLAAFMAQNPPSQNEINQAMVKFNGSGVDLKPANGKEKESNLIEFTSGNGLGTRGNVKASSDNSAADILSKLKPGAKGAPNSKILEFAEKAEIEARKKAQIRKENTPLFEIISLRYQTSGRRLLEVDLNN